MMWQKRKKKQKLVRYGPIPIKYNELQIQLGYRISLRYTKAKTNVHTDELEFSLYLSPLGVLILKIIQPEFCSFESKNKCIP